LSLPAASSLELLPHLGQSFHEDRGTRTLGFRHRFQQIDRAIEVAVDGRLRRLEVKPAEFFEVIAWHMIRSVPVAAQHRAKRLERLRVEHIVGLQPRSTGN